MEHKLDKFFGHIRNFNVSHYVWINETKDLPIFQTVHSMKKVGDLKDYQKQVARVLAIKQAKKKKYYYLEVEGEELGWAELINSRVVYSKPKEHVKIDLQKFLDLQDKQIFVVSKNNLRLLKDQMLDSRFVMIKDGVEYEALFKKHQLQGWFSSDSLMRSEKVNIPVRGYKDGFTIYEFNNLTSEVKIDEEKIHPIKIVHMFRDIGLAKIKTGMGNYWTDMSFLEYDETAIPEYAPPYNFEETVVYDLIQNISEERKMTLELVERLNSQFKNMDVQVEPADTSEVQDEVPKEQTQPIDHDIRKKLELEREKREKIERKYNNLKNSFLGKLQTKYWEMRK
ncbi:GW dipeptide domain-containing protein [Salinicoccus roseus]|uniref:GW dipeptide domain-containing protein n=1 Tax=Salinicoccus roseus TaxID=45670 RepID=A0A0C2E822_9STAP|nr:GW dipeptide domain-containing protein [Salinicoccus roseus]KIH71452.1 hypothetical protein SN16_01865 [Salinicoccus roseus]MDB0579518.1 GW dipeptide domain-containing protein [Salinicoccus roseus]